MASRIIEGQFDPWQAIRAHQEQSKGSSSFGATASFIGTMRDFNDGADVTEMTLEHYPEMTSNYLDKLIAEANQQWDLLDVLIIHRVGVIIPGEPIMLIACWSAHRRASLDACSWLIEELKHRAPFWKRETRTNGEKHWVEKNTNGL